MTDKVNGYVEQGSWFERDTSIMNVQVTLAPVAPAVDPDDFENINVGGNADQVMRVLQTRGTVIGYTVISATEVNVMFGTSAGSFKGVFDAPKTGVDPVVMDELVAAINAIPGAAAAADAALVVFEGFAGATPLPVIRT